MEPRSAPEIASWCQIANYDIWQTCLKVARIAAVLFINFGFTAPVLGICGLQVDSI